MEQGLGGFECAGALRERRYAEFRRILATECDSPAGGGLLAARPCNLLIDWYAR